MNVHTPYARKVFEQGQLRETAKKLAAAIPALMHKHGANTIVVTGKSGISMGFAVSMLVDFPLVVVRKPGENSHGWDIEGPDGHEVERYILLDDFIATGATVKRVQHQFRERATMAAVLEYDSTDYRSKHCNLGELPVEQV